MCNNAIVSSSHLCLTITDMEFSQKSDNRMLANQQIAFGSEENAVQRAELIIANKELVFQKEEKGKRAAELVITKKELKKANEEICRLNEGLEQKVMERTQQLEAVNKELEAFSYSVSHDLRAPLRSIHGFAQILKEDYGAQLGANGNQLTDTIVRSAKEMGHLIDDLLTFSRLGRKEFVKRDVQIHDMVTLLCNESKKEMGDRNIQFEVNALLPAKGDSTTIKQVWINLISNACKYSRLKEKAIIKINSEVNGNQIIYHIQDNGAGFDMRYADKLFGVFQRLHTDEEFEGTGVGLAIIQRIISKHGGRVWADGKVNEGASFYFSLPC